METKKLILASGSPRRIEMLQKNGISPVIIKPQVEENLPEAITPEQAVMYLALKKGLAVEAEGAEGIILAADTVVYKDRIIGKPADFADAVSILKELRNDVHHVITGVSIIDSNSINRRVFWETTKVFVKDYTDQDILDYIATDEPWDKAGGYAIQGEFGRHVSHVEGDLNNVIGFPFDRIKAELRSMGFGSL